MKIAAIQLNNYIGEMVQSFIGAETLIQEAVHQGAKFVALPELSTCGYIPNTDIWSFGEPREGITSGQKKSRKNIKFMLVLVF